MTGRRRRRSEGAASSPYRGLELIGMAPGERLRFRRRPGAHWQAGVALGRETDGSLRLRDDQGATRTIPLGLVEVTGRGSRGAPVWEPASARAARTEQLHLF